MKEDELIGLMGVFVLTFCLIALYHMLGKIGRHRKRYGAQIKREKQPDEDQRPDHIPRTTSGKDDAWLLWSPGLDKRADPLKPGYPGRRETRGSWLRS